MCCNVFCRNHRRFGAFLLLGKVAFINGLQGSNSNNFISCNSKKRSKSLIFNLKDKKNYSYKQVILLIFRKKKENITAFGGKKREKKKTPKAVKKKSKKKSKKNN